MCVLYYCYLQSGGNAVLLSLSSLIMGSSAWQIEKKGSLFMNLIILSSNIFFLFWEVVVYINIRKFGKQISF